MESSNLVEEELRVPILFAGATDDKASPRNPDHDRKGRAAKLFWGVDAESEAVLGTEDASCQVGLETRWSRGAGITDIRPRCLEGKIVQKLTVFDKFSQDKRRVYLRIWIPKPELFNRWLCVGN